MIALDTNVLIGVMVASSSLHGETMRGIAKLDDDLCTTPTNIGETLRLLTHPKVFTSPLKVGKAVTALSDLCRSYAIRILDEETEWWRSLGDLEKLIPGLKGNEIVDARIAICLRQHNVRRIFTFDADFKKYPFLRVVSFVE